MDWKIWEKELAALPGRIGLYYRNLATCEEWGRLADERFESASVIKLPVFAAIERMAAAGEADLDERLICREADKLPSCGALRYFTGEPELDLRTLCRLMIALSDNSATNLLLRRFGLERLNREFAAMGLERSRLERLLFDAESSARGLENRVTPREMGRLLEAIARRRFVSEAVSEEIESVLRCQQIKHKIPGYLPKTVAVAHKTGEDAGITNDVGLVFAPKPFVLCFLANGTDVPAAERCIRALALALYEDSI